MLSYDRSWASIVGPLAGVLMPDFLAARCGTYRHGPVASGKE